MPKGEVKLKDISGKEITLKSAVKKNGLLVMFSCNTCPYVIKNQQRTNEICKYAMENKFGVVLINSNEAQRGDDDSYAAMKEYAKTQGFNWYYAVDERSELADAFGANRTPETFLFDASGKLVYHGAIDDNPSEPENVVRKHLKEAIDEMVHGKEVSVKTSRSVGCTIKRI
jgi:peroxiredoxin